MCRSEAPVSNMSLKNASSFAMSPLAPLGGVRRDYKTFNEPMRSGRVKSRMASRLQVGGPDKAGLLILPLGHHRQHRGESAEVVLTGVSPEGRVDEAHLCPDVFDRVDVHHA